MPFIPEEKIDRALEQLADLTEAVQIQTQAIGQLSETLDIHGQWLSGIHAAVARKAESDPLGDLLKALIAADRHHAEMLQAVLNAVLDLGKAKGG